MQHVSALKAAILREETAAHAPLYASGKGTSTARTETPVAAGDTALLTALDKIISLTLKPPMNNPEKQEFLNQTAYGGDDFSAGVKSDESEMVCAFQTANLLNLAIQQVDTSKTIEAAIGLVNSFMFHKEDPNGAVDLMGCCPTQWRCDITKDKIVTQTLKWKARSGKASVAVTNHPAQSTATKSLRKDLTVFSLGGVAIATLQIEKASFGIDLEWDETEVLNDEYGFEKTLKKVTWFFEAEYQAPNNATYASSWEALKLTNTVKADLAGAVVLGSLFSWDFTNLLLKDISSSEYPEGQGPIKHKVRLESTSATVRSAHA